MEKQERYKFNGFTFGGTVNRFYNLRIEVVNHTGIGTSCAVGFAFELTNDERLALINHLASVDLTGKDEEDN